MYRYVTAAQETYTNDLIGIVYLALAFRSIFFWTASQCQCVNMCRSVDWSYLKSSLFPMSQAVGWQTTWRPSSGFTSMEFSQKLGSIS